MNTYYFTFGHGHYDNNHESLYGFYTTIKARSEEIARRIISAKRGVKWAFCYQNNLVISKHEMEYIPFKKLTEQHAKGNS